MEDIPDSQTIERVLLPEFADSIDGLANGILGSLLFGAGQPLVEDLFDIDFERYTSGLRLSGPTIGHIYFDFHEFNFSMRFENLGRGFCKHCAAATTKRTRCS